MLYMKKIMKDYYNILGIDKNVSVRRIMIERERERERIN
ncbi:hypothetical protein GvMRE_I2g174 [endosymbiont GvMRE of Glomus versiforme]|nr:hypothetical protein GvMRE_I2g174 [endosymbiont GvMRE of Glomus versiforme]